MYFYIYLCKANGFLSSLRHVFVLATAGYHCLVLLLFSSSTATALVLLQVLPLDATGTAAAEGRLQGEVDVLLGVQAHDERRDVDHLLADTVKTNGRRTPYLD